jgi:hypothetical protein
VVGSRGVRMWRAAEMIGCGRQQRWGDVVVSRGGRTWKGAEVVGYDGQQR